ncbi:DUF456 family protein [Paenibacillus sp. P96]|uniref:DUF456 family protein n=1 Tax=Paenibacillus zeirhizosphaerae TaxID=2987519 RepID=A0ABT9FUX6_9BACL|nr:DUF456 family protein [Paenibacillus sp. P96]MDP4098420.1 DUF456 family protein [Paenibacillus sp. P96]
MDILGWVLIIALFVIGMAGAVYPVLPGALAIYFAFFIYGWFFSFSSFTTWFWIIQTLIVVVLFVADYIVNAWGVNKFGGSKLSTVLSTVGVIIGPFVIPAFGLILGPFIGAVIGELINRQPLDKAIKVGFGSVVGLFTSTVMKVILQLVMIVVFLIYVF